MSKNIKPLVVNFHIEKENELREYLYNKENKSKFIKDSIKLMKALEETLGTDDLIKLLLLINVDNKSITTNQIQQSNQNLIAHDKSQLVEDGATFDENVSKVDISELTNMLSNI